MDIVPPTTPIRRNRAHNMDTARLTARRDFMLANLRTIADGRLEFAYRAYELQAIENVLVARGALDASARRTVYGNDRVAA